MQWKELIAEITAVGASGDSAQTIAGIEYDSRRIKPGRGVRGHEGRLD